MYGLVRSGVSRGVKMDFGKRRVWTGVGTGLGTNVRDCGLALVYDDVLTNIRAGAGKVQETGFRIGVRHGVNTDVWTDIWTGFRSGLGSSVWNGVGDGVGIDVWTDVNGFRSGVGTKTRKNQDCCWRWFIHIWTDVGTGVRNGFEYGLGTGIADIGVDYVLTMLGMELILVDDLCLDWCHEICWGCSKG